MQVLACLNGEIMPVEEAEGPGLGPGFPVRRLGLRGLPDVPGPVLAGSGAPGAAEAKSRGAGFAALTT